jgi:CRISPR-associated protein Csh1
MIREIINFVNNLDEDFKNQNIKPKEGLHILLALNEDSKIILSEYAYHSKKIEDESEFIKRMKNLCNHAWCIGTDKCLDLPAKGIHSCSPFCVGFKMEFLEGGGKNSRNKEKNKLEINNRLDKYFIKAFSLLDSIEVRESLQPFREIFTVKKNENYFENILLKISSIFKQKLNDLNSQIIQLQEYSSNATGKNEKELFKEQIDKLKKESLKYKQLESTDYVIFYLDEDVLNYKKAHQHYLSANLFLYKDKFLTAPNMQNLVWGVNGFMNSFNSNMPFLTHQTASFEISGRVSNIDMKSLYDFEQVLPRNILPKTLPIFIFREEIQREFIGLFKESGFKLGYKETIQKLWGRYSQYFNNYYLLNWHNTKDGLVFQDFDFVSKFEYEFNAQIENLFEIKEKDSRNTIHYPKINNVFDLEQRVFKPLIQSKYNSVEYFTELKDIKKDSYDKLNNTFQTFSKYRKAVYDFVYKSKRQGIDAKIFYDMVFSHIKDDLKHDRSFSIKEKLNIWFSLYEKFINFKDKKNVPTMASNLKNYQEFVAKLSMGKADTEGATDAYFAFAAGQVIEYIIQKSKSDNMSYQLLEPYLQQAKCQEFKKAIANDIARYKHAINDNETRFKSVCDFVLTYDTDVNMKELMPEILAGIFSKNQFFHKTIIENQ